VPEGVLNGPATVAVNVTLCPYIIPLFWVEVTVVVVEAWFTLSVAFAVTGEV
jgi:hypothetical protein